MEHQRREQERGEARQQCSHLVFSFLSFCLLLSPSSTSVSSITLSPSLLLFPYVRHFSSPSSFRLSGQFQDRRHRPTPFPRLLRLSVGLKSWHLPAVLLWGPGGVRSVSGGAA